MGNLDKRNNQFHRQKPEPGYKHSAARKSDSLKKIERRFRILKKAGWLAYKFMWHRILKPLSWFMEGN